MAFDAHKNFAGSTVAVAPSPPSSGTSLTVASGEGARYPAVPFNATVCLSGTVPTPANAEIVRVTARAGDVLTIVRAQEQSTARMILVGDVIAATITAQTLTDVELLAKGGDVVGPASAINASLAQYNGATGKVIMDALIPSAQVARRDQVNTFATGPQALTGGAVFSGGGTQNTLNDYREGTFTPFLTSDGGGSGLTYTTQSGSYVKVGQLVFITWYLQLSSKGTMAGFVIWNGLPFPCNGAGTLTLCPVMWDAMGTALGGMFLQYSGGATTSYLRFLAAGGSTSYYSAALQWPSMTNTTIMAGTCCYRST